MTIIFVAYLGLIYIDNYSQPWRMRETPAVRPYEEPILPMAAGTVPITGGEALYRASRGENLKSPLDSQNASIIEAGRSQYLLYCAQCHGKHHDGNGPVGQSFHPLPTDLRSKEVQALPAGVVFKEISYGIQKPDARQPALATTITVLDRWRIVTYVKSLGLRQ
jgi:mono/diheme cytochrome c family protein